MWYFLFDFLYEKRKPDQKTIIGTSREPINGLERIIQNVQGLRAVTPCGERGLSKKRRVKGRGGPALTVVGMGVVRVDDTLEEFSRNW